MDVADQNGRIALRTLPVIIALICASCAGTRSGREARDARKPGGAFNIRIVSDSVPDFSTRENFVRSALSGWKTDQEKCLAQFRWMHRCRRVGPYVPEDGRPVLDPVLFFNSYGITFCSMIAEMNVSLWEAAGYLGRCRSLNGHVVSEVRYGGDWHMFDNDFCNYFLEADGTVASVDELHAGRKRVPGKHYLYDHCPTASCVGGRIFMGPSSASVKDVAKNWYSELRRWGRDDASCAHAGHRYIIDLPAGSSYTRYWKPLGTGTRYARLFRNGRDPAVGSTLRNSRANGLWGWVIDVTDSSTLFAGENVTVADEAEARHRPRSGIAQVDRGKPGYAIYRLATANVLTSIEVSARATHDVSEIAVSGDGGLSWHPVRLTPKRHSGGAQGAIADPVAGRLEALVRVRLENGNRLLGLTVVAMTQVNPRTLPALRLGKNTIVAGAGEQLETITLHPWLSYGKADRYTVRCEGFEQVKRMRDTTPTIESTGPSELVLRATAPRDIKLIRMASTMHIRKPGRHMTASVSFDGGDTWQEIGRQGYTKGRFVDYRTDHETRDIPDGTRDVLLRYAFNGDGTGLVNVVAHVGYEPAGGFMPYDITYTWDEWQDGGWKPFEHHERVSGRYHKYVIPVGGSRPPRMKSVTIADAAGTKPPADKSREVHADASDPYRLDYGNVISTGCEYRVSRTPSQAFPDTTGKVLTDGYVGLASFWGLENINLTGRKRKDRVGQLVVWAPGDDVAVTIDLGEVRTVGAARVCAVQPNENVLYPERMAVEVSPDGKTFTKAGATDWEACFFPPGDELRWEGWDSPVYEHLPAGGIIDFKFPVIFERPLDARYVRFRLAKPTRDAAGIGLWEIQVYDRINRTPWDERLRLPEPEEDE
ncbi:MAG: discoidin domain-containing protein [Planctomycetota bacterium]